MVGREAAGERWAHVGRMLGACWAHVVCMLSTCHFIFLEPTVVSYLEPTVMSCLEPALMSCLEPTMITCLEPALMSILEPTHECHVLSQQSGSHLEPTTGAQHVTTRHGMF